jgi:N-carbamoylputrescine amidase
MVTAMLDKTFKFGLIQMSMSDDVDANLNHACELIDKAAKQGAEVICLPELFRSLYFCQSENHDYFNLAESIPGPTTEQLSKIAKQLGIVIISSLFERRTAGIYHNTAAIIDKDGSLAGIYRKMHIPDDPLYYEKFYFTPGDLGFKSIETSVCNVGPLVCWDQWYPEAARLTAMQGAEILFYPTAIGWHPKEKAEYGKSQVEAWETMMRSHAIANGVYVVACNRFGHEGPEDGGIEFWGNSFITDPFGRILAKASHDKEEILIATFDPKLQEATRQNWPFFRDRRIDAYDGLLERFGK